MAEWTIDTSTLTREEIALRILEVVLPANLARAEIHQTASTSLDVKNSARFAVQLADDLLKALAGGTSPR